MPRLFQHRLLRSNIVEALRYTEKGWEVVGIAASGVPGAGSAVKAVADFTIGLTDAPDIGGVFELRRNGAWDSLEAPVRQDSTLPNWDNLAWDDVLLDADIILRAKLFENEYRTTTKSHRSP